MSTDKTSDQTFLRDLHSLRRHYALFQVLMGTFTKGNTQVNATANEKYLELCLKIEGILENPKFDTLYAVYHRPFEIYYLMI